MTKTPDDQPQHRYFAFIRAINVGGRRLTNEELTRPFIQLGLRDVAAYQAAGNITFRSTDVVPAGPLRAAIAEAYGFDSPVFVRSQAELNAISAARPFTAAELAETEGRVQISFLDTAPSDSASAEALALVPPGERVVFSGREWFWLPARGISDSQLPISTIEGLVGPMTIRTLGTIERMLEKFA